MSKRIWIVAMHRTDKPDSEIRKFHVEASAEGYAVLAADDYMRTYVQGVWKLSNVEPAPFWINLVGE